MRDIWNPASNDSAVGNGDIWRLTPDINGSYVNGTWSQLASLPDGYTPLFYASAVLPDGRVIFEGGEYDLVNYIWSNQGAIYDPIANSWTSISPPPFFTNELECYTGPINPNPIGDADSKVLEDGTFMLMGALCSKSALLNADTLTWTETGFNKFGINNEENWVLLPNGKVLTFDCNIEAICNPDFVPNLTGSELYNPKTGSWSSAGSTIVQLDQFGITYEGGPLILRPNGTVFAVGGTGFTAVNGKQVQYCQQVPDQKVSLALKMAQLLCYQTAMYCLA